MEQDLVVDGIRAIFPEQNGVGVLSSNVYLLESEDGLLMIDAGSGKLELDEPDRVLLTHGHYDHTKGVKKDWKALMHPADIKFKSKMPYWVPPQAGPLDMRPMKWGQFELEFVHTPGHTPGSICIFEKRNKVLFSGDTLFQEGDCGRTDLLGGDAEDMRESLELIADIGYEVLCPGHGPYVLRED
jgi:glyoxylase-like metal-dependent hydrolase (beta-lactamase superfamily II)